MKKQSGITLVALVITVIILLILAGITINLTVGQKGIITRAIQAKENTIQAQKDEEEALNRLWGELENGGGTSGGSSGSEDREDESTAKEEHILEGYKAYSGGKLLIGTMPNREAITEALNAGESYKIPEGYHNGSGVISANSLKSQTPATAVANDIATGKTAWVNGELVTGNGTMLGDINANHATMLGFFSKYVNGGTQTLSYTFTEEYKLVIGYAGSGASSLAKVPSMTTTVTNYQEISAGGTMPYGGYAICYLFYDCKVGDKITLSAKQESSAVLFGIE